MPRLPFRHPARAGRFVAVVTATLVAGLVAASPAFADAPTAPAQPTVAAGNAQITVSFVAPADGGSVITGYDAACVSSDGGAAGAASGTASPIVVGALSNGNSYTCTVTATNGDGTSGPSPASEVVIPSTVPSAPAQPGVVAGNAQITVSFAAPANGGSAITGYNISCVSSNGGAAGSAADTASPTVVGALTNGKSYTCSVTATNANGPGAASVASAGVIPSTTPAAPAQPGVVAGNAQVTVSFVPPVDGGSPITGYGVSCVSSNGGVAGAVSDTASPTVVGALTNGKSYTCTVTATNANGAGAVSPASAAVIPSTIPSAPAPPTLTAGNAQVTVSFAAPLDGGSPITGFGLVCTSSNGGTPGSASDTASPTVVGGLTNGKSYTCTVSATNANGTGPASLASAAAVPSTVPSAPAQPTVSAGNGQVTVSFGAPADGGSAITGYAATCASSDGGALGTGNGAGSPIVVGGLTNGKSYTCTVTAANANGSGPASAASAAVVPAKVPDAPAQPIVGAGNGQLTVSFVAPANGGSAITGYSAACVSSNGGAAGSGSGAGSPIVINGLSNGKSYTCTVTATNSAGDGPPSPASNAVVPSTIPGAPGQPVAAAGNAQLTVSFAAPTDGGSPITGYEAACVSSNGGVAGSAPGAGSPIVVGLLTNGKSYTCTVTATNGNGDGPASAASAIAIPSAVPNAPAQPTVVRGNGQVTVSFVAPADGGSTITNYGATCVSSNGGVTGSTNGAGSPIVVGGLTNGSSYTCTVTATNANGTGAASPASAVVVPSTVPGAPAQPGVVAGNAQVTVSFVPPATGGSAITGYTVACVSSNGGTPGSTSDTATPTVVGGLTNGSSYTCTVTASNVNGAGPVSAASAVVVPSTVPSAPAQPGVVAGNAQVTVSFVPPATGGSAITGYTVACVSSNGGTPGSTSDTATPTVVGGLTNGSSYTCTVTATNANGAGPVSPASAAVVPSTVPSAPAQPGVVAGNAEVTVSFVAPANGGSAITGYTVACVSSNGGTPGSASDTASPTVIGGLTNGSSYTCTVTATNANGAGPVSAASAAVVPSTVPSAPAQPTVVAGNAQITVSFVPPANGGSAITGYNVSCVSSNGGTPGAASDTTTPTVVAGLTNGSSYTCTVTASNVNGAGPVSAASAVVVPSTVPSAPAQPTVVAGNAQITVSFVPPATGGSAITGYTVVCVSSNGGVTGSASDTATPTVISALTNGKSYSCTVTASNANGTGATSPASAAVIPSTIPGTPAQPTVVPGNAQVTVSFVPPTDGGNPITGYSVVCTSSNGGATGSVSDVASPTVVGGLTNGKSYTCTVAATNGNGAGGTSPASAAVIPSTVPSAPALPTVVAGNAEVTVSFVPPADGGSAITGYTVSCVSSNGGATGSSSDTVSPTTVGGLTNGKSYTCTVTASNANGAGAASPASAAVVPHTVPSAPAAPIVGAGNAQVTLVFVAPFDGGSPITGYNAACVSSNGGTAGSAPGAGSPIVIGGLTNGKSYTCTVSATNAIGTGPSSPASVGVVPNRVPDPPAQPTVAAGNAQLTVSFVAPFDGGSPITGYNVLCSSSNGGTAGSVPDTASPTVVSGLTNGKSYTCVVTATNANGTGAQSTASAVAIPNTVPSAPAAPTLVPGNAQVTVSFVAPFDGGSGITNYGAACVSSNGGTAGAANGAGSPIAVGGLTNGKSYTCTVTATNANGAGPASPASAAAIPSTVPVAPAQPTATPGNAQISVAFVAPANGGSAITGYNVVCTSSNGGVAGSAADTATPTVVGGLTNGKSYTCTVTASNANGAGPASPASAAVIPSTIPSAPAQPTAAVGNGQVTVSFVAPANGGSAITRFDATCVSSNGGAPGANSGVSSPILVGSLSNGMTYTCTVTATNANGVSPASPASATVVPSTVPTAPGQPTAGVGNAQLTVSFVAPFDGGSAITGFTAACVSSNGGAAGTASGPASPIVVNGLTNGKSYTCTVKATNSNGAGASSVPSPVAVPNRVPDVPAAPTLAPANAQLTVSFVAPFDGGSAISGYATICISSNGGTAGSANGPASPLVVNGLSNGKSYTCTLTATNANGTSQPSPASAAAIPSTIPNTPAKAKVAAGNALVTVSFSAPFNGGSAITSYAATCTSTNGGRTASKTGTRSPLKVSGLTNDKTYRCTVTATNANGVSHGSPASAVATPVDPVALLSRVHHGFRLFAGDGGVFTFGDAANYGSAARVATHLVVGMTTTPDNHGYWLVATDGGIFSFGNAKFYGSTGAIRLNRPIVGMAATPSGKGYWLVASDGGIFSFGDARFFGSTGAIRLNRPIVGMTSTTTGKGYWLVASDGGIFTFGDARFHGSAAGVARASVAGMATAAGGGYWIAAADGHVYNFGGAPKLGDAPASQLRLPVRGIQSTASGKGYWLAAGDGGLFAFGDAPYISWPGPLTLRATIQGVSR